MDVFWGTRPEPWEKGSGPQGDLRDSWVPALVTFPKNRFPLKNTGPVGGWIPSFFNKIPQKGDGFWQTQKTSPNHPRRKFQVKIPQGFLTTKPLGAASAALLLRATKPAQWRLDVSETPKKCPWWRLQPQGVSQKNVGPQTFTNDWCNKTQKQKFHVVS